MKSYFYPGAIHTAITAFADMFNNMSVRVYDKEGKITGVKPVPLTIAPKEKIAALLLKTDINDVDPKSDVYLPKLSIMHTGFTWDPARMRGKYENRLLNIEYFDHGTVDANGKSLRRQMQIDMQPVPYNMSFDVTIWTKYLVDGYQLIENILPWFAPELHLSIKERNFGIERKIKVTLNSISQNFQYELDETTKRVLQWNLSFDAEVVMYKPMEIKPEILCSIISISEVPCKRAPFQGEKIVQKDATPDADTPVADHDVSTVLTALDQTDSYDLMARYWRYGNTVMTGGQYIPCVIDQCQEPMGNRPTWASDQNYTQCNPLKKKPIVFVDAGTPPTSGTDDVNLRERIITYWQEQVSGLYKFSGPTMGISPLPPVDADGNMTFGEVDKIRVYSFFRVVNGYGDTIEEKTMIDNLAYPTPPPGLEQLK